MPATKKSATTRRSPAKKTTKKSSASASATKTKATKKTTPTRKRKVAKKSTKKAIKKTDGAVHIPIHRTRAQVSTFDEKLARLDTMAATKKAATSKSSVTKKNTERSRALMTLPNMSLSVLSPYRFPINVDAVAVQTARYGGVFFVAVGAFFTVFYAQYISSDTPTYALTQNWSQTASVCEGHHCHPEHTDTHHESHTEELSDPEPAVEFRVHGGEPLTDTVTLEAFVKDAIAVKFSVYEKDTQTVYTLGSAKRIDAQQWRFRWDTTEYLDGYYKLLAFVENEQGSYEVADRLRLVENVPLPLDSEIELESANIDIATSTEVSEETVAVTESTESVAETEVTAFATEIMVPEQTILTGEERIPITAANATYVKVYLRTANNEQVYLGRAYKRTDGSWRYLLDTEQFADGAYVLVVRAIDSITDEEVMDKVAVSIVNNDATLATETVGTETDADTKDDLAAEAEEKLSPDISLVIEQPAPVEGYADIYIAFGHASRIEVYATARLSNNPIFVGSAVADDEEQWHFRWNTKNIPNGEYDIHVTARTKYGSFDSDTVATVVLNEVAAIKTEEETKQVTDLQAAFVEASSTVSIASPKPLSAPDAELAETTAVSATETEVETLLADEREIIDDELKRLAAAVRSGDEAAVTRIKSRLAAVQTDLVNTATASGEDSTASAEIEERITRAVARVEEDVAKTEKIVKERTNESATKDSDHDGVADYDEVNIYNTDPFSADSDGDGFTDGAEILNGYNPTDDTPEAVVAFESPKEVGVVREDILVVKDIVAVAPVDDADDAEPKEAAIISGTALPNSYVTLYVFSTPVIVTVKTDADGSWTYRFDKELEDGEHEIYVGVTDNAGKIVAKSEPFTFIKEAQAFTPAEAAIVGTTAISEPTPSFMSEYLIYLVLSISVVAIGLVLILLGLHVDARPRGPVTGTEKTAV